MIYTSILEEWPLTRETVYLRFTTDGVNYQEKLVKESEINSIDCVGVPEWRPIDPPEWMKEDVKQAIIDRRKLLEHQGILDEVDG